MLLLDGSLVFSATDLSGFLDCGHLPTLERAAVRGQLAKPPGPHPLSAHYGDRHEADYLRRLEAGGLRVAELERPASHGRDDLAAAQRETVATLAEGYDVVYQGTLFDGTWLGHPDFLVRTDRRSGHWPHAYDVVDTKLARRAKATALLQVALYGQLLAPLQGTEPGELVLALGDGSEERFAYRGVAAYLRAIQARFVEPLASDPPYPYPVEHCALCRWDGHCVARRRDDDHLSLIAGISDQQVRRLERSGVATVAALAGDPLPPGLRIGRGALDRLRRQAAEQVRSRGAGRLSYARRPAPAGQGLDALPAPDEGDLFFDMEGFPYAEDGGLEYLFGWVDAAGTFHHRFAEDRPGERRAFEQFMDELAERRRRHPGLHVYHYASYERSALSRLSNRHGVREEEVADLLRHGILVDLYRVVRQALVVGAESYSIKYLEPLYGLQRTGEVQNAAESLEMYQEWLDSDPRDEAIRARIAAYNEVDCRSTLRLRDWLLALPAPTPADLAGAADPVDPTATAGSTGSTGPAGRRVPSGPSEKLAAWLALVEELAGRLLAGVAEDPADRDAEQQGRALLAHLLRFHQREDNAQWRDYFARLELSVDELRDDDQAAVADLRFEELGPAVRRSQDHVYSFPAQEVGLRVGDRPVDPTTGNAAGSLVVLEAPAGDGEDGSARGRLVLRRALTSEVPHPPALVPPGPIENDVLRQALVRLAEWVLAHGLASPLPGWRAARQLLLRRPPRLHSAAVAGPGGRLAGPDEHGAEALLRLAPALDGATLPVQGPPGSGKTYSSAQIVVDAVARGDRVGVTATSHRVIENLL
ncbi:MAG TPA: TM0106 family RecB-like putative nuclease, partial [Acidimicrobiales bacterium]|nr:TM0106 family RecB-like putative nuclease [Acidimicrobiales bacterium]